MARLRGVAHTIAVNSATITQRVSHPPLLLLPVATSTDSAAGD